MVLKRRLLAKAATWRICATTVTILTIIIVTGDVRIGLIVGPIDILTKLVLYYWHEKMWLKSRFGIRGASHYYDQY